MTEDIRLPPLPYPYTTPAYKTVKAVIQEYTRAAIKADRQRLGETYNYKRIGWELERTAMGDGFYGNALRVAKDIPGVSEEDREVLDRYAAGKQQGMDHVALQNIALNIYTIPQPAAPQQPSTKCPGAGCTDQGCPAHYATPQPTKPDEERLAMEAVMESVDPATWPGLTIAQRCALGRFAKPQPATPEQVQLKKEMK